MPTYPSSSIATASCMRWRARTHLPVGEHVADEVEQAEVATLRLPLVSEQHPLDTARSYVRCVGPSMPASASTTGSAASPLAGSTRWVRSCAGHQASGADSRHHHQWLDTKPRGGFHRVPRSLSTSVSGDVRQQTVEPAAPGAPRLLLTGTCLFGDVRFLDAPRRSGWKRWLGLRGGADRDPSGDWGFCSAARRSPIVVRPEGWSYSVSNSNSSGRGE